MFSYNSMFDDHELHFIHCEKVSMDKCTKEELNVLLNIAFKDGFSVGFKKGSDIERVNTERERSRADSNYAELRSIRKLLS